MMDLKFGVPDTGQQLAQVYAINNKLNAHVADFEFAKEYRDLARRFCPVSTEATRPGGPHGNLRDSIRAWRTKSGATVAAGGVSNLEGDPARLYGNNLVDYSVYVEYGTWKMRAQPYMRPAMDIMMHSRTMVTALQRSVLGNELPL